MAKVPGQGGVGSQRTTPPSVQKAVPGNGKASNGTGQHKGYRVPGVGGTGKGVRQQGGK